jgi:hypothetical protein
VAKIRYLVGHIGEFVLHVGQRRLDEGRHVVNVFRIISWNAFLRHFRHELNLNKKNGYFLVFSHEEAYRVFYKCRQREIALFSCFQ